MTKEFKLRDITPLDEEALVKLYDNVWTEAAGTKQGKTKWMLSSPIFYGICAIGAEGQIIGSRPSFYSNIYYGDRPLKAVQCGNSCVHSDFRRYGIFSKMNNMFLDKFFVEGRNDLIFNISVYASKMAYQKLGWVYIDALSKLTYFANFWNVLWKTKFNPKKLAGNVIYQQKTIPNLNDFDFKLLEIRENYFCQTINLHTYYGKDFFSWRLNSDTNIALLQVDNLGVVVYKIGEKNGLNVITIGELFLYEYNKKNLKQAIDIVKKTFKADLLEIAITEQHPCYQFYKKVGFINNPIKKYLNLGVKVVSDEMKQIALNPSNWVLSGIDIDTF